MNNFTSLAFQKKAEQQVHKKQKVVIKNQEINDRFLRNLQTKLDVDFMVYCLSMISKFPITISITNISLNKYMWIETNKK